MDFGDIIYFVLLVFFMILGFFNDSRKKKQQRKQSETALPPFFDDFEDEGSKNLDAKEVVYNTPPVAKRQVDVPPPFSVSSSVDSARREFRSSSDFVSIHDVQPVDSTMDFNYDKNSFYEKDMNSLDTTEDMKAKQVLDRVHPLIKDLRGRHRREELAKGIVYAEILQRKY